MINKKLQNAFLSPKSIAIVGASSNPKKTSARVQRYLVNHGYKGDVFPVNPNREEIFGLKSYPNLTKIKKTINKIMGVN